MSPLRWLRRRSILTLFIAGATLVAIVTLAVGFGVFPAEQFGINITATFWGVMLGSVIVAWLLDGIGNLHRRRRWAQIRSAVVWDLQHGMMRAAARWMPVAEFRRFEFESQRAGKDWVEEFDAFLTVQSDRLKSLGARIRTGDGDLSSDESEYLDSFSEPERGLRAVTEMLDVLGRALSRTILVGEEPELLRTLLFLESMQEHLRDDFKYPFRSRLLAEDIASVLDGVKDVIDYDREVYLQPWRGWRGDA